nr:ATP-dependent helicase C-terminal domain-containing protein [Azotobacter salinestris]
MCKRHASPAQHVAGFRTSTRAEVRMSLKRRYPRHYWPDDPLIAEPTARARPRR